MISVFIQNATPRGSGLRLALLWCARPARRPARRVLDDRVGPREDQAGMAVVELDQVGRCPTRVTDLEDHAGPLGVANGVAVYVQPVSDYSLHASTSSSLARYRSSGEPLVLPRLA